MSRHKAKCSVLLAALSCLANAPGYALPEDKLQPVHLEADFADLQEKIHQAVFEGNVQLVQGSTQLAAARAITHGDAENKLRLAIVWGKANQPAHYQTITDPDKPVLHAWAKEIRYYPLEHKVELIGNARVSQGENQMAAEKIVYHLKENQIDSQGEQKKPVRILLNSE